MSDRPSHVARFHCVIPKDEETSRCNCAISAVVTLEAGTRSDSEHWIIPDTAIASCRVQLRRCPMAAQAHVAAHYRVTATQLEPSSVPLTRSARKSSCYVHCLDQRRRPDASHQGDEAAAIVIGSRPIRESGTYTDGQLFASRPWQLPRWHVPRPNPGGTDEVGRNVLRAPR